MDMLVPSKEGNEEVCRFWTRQLDTCWSRQLHQAAQYTAAMTGAVSTGSSRQPLSSDGRLERRAGHEQPGKLLCVPHMYVLSHQGTYHLYQYFTNSSIHANIIFVLLKAVF